MRFALRKVNPDLDKKLSPEACGRPPGLRVRWGSSWRQEPPQGQVAAGAGGTRYTGTRIVAQDCSYARGTLDAASVKREPGTSGLAASGPRWSLDQEGRQ